MADSEIQSRKKFFVENLCPELNAEYCQDKNILKSKFALSHKGFFDIEKSNSIVGKIDDYWYCICEYKYIIHSKHSSRTVWGVVSSVVMPQNNFPEFNLAPKSAALTKDIITAVFLSPVVFVFFILVLFQIFALIAMLLNFSETIKQIIEEPSKIFAFIMFLIPIVITYFLSSFAFKSIKNIFQTLFGQGKYGINNQTFKSKFAFTEVKDDNAIRRVFSPKVVEKIVNFKPELAGISSKGNCLHFESNDKITNVLDCKKYVNNIISQAKIFEN